VTARDRLWSLCYASSATNLEIEAALGAFAKEAGTPTLRDQFAMAALHGLFATGCDPEHVSTRAYLIADAMLAARTPEGT
jgi:hypothetical protein